MARSSAAGVFVERAFELVHAAGTSRLRARVFQPIRMPTGEYGCAFELRAGRKTIRKRRMVFGADGLQALLAALGFVDLELDLIVRSTPGGKIAAWERRDLRRLRLGVAKRKRSKRA